MSNKLNIFNKLVKIINFISCLKTIWLYQLCFSKAGGKIYWLNAVWYLGLYPETEKWLSGKSCEVQIKTGINVPVLITCLTNVLSLCKMYNFRGNWVKGV